MERSRQRFKKRKLYPKEDIQELLIKPSMEYSHYIAFVHKFVINMEELFIKTSLNLIELFHEFDELLILVIRIGRLLSQDIIDQFILE